MSNTPTPALELTTEDFHASWRPPCQAQHPIVDALASELHEAAVKRFTGLTSRQALLEALQA
jgi:thiol-disulfide isomerase/thioredoxin